MIQQKSNYQTNMAELLWFLLTKKEGVEGHFHDVANKTNVPIISKKRPAHKLISDLKKNQIRFSFMFSMSFLINCIIWIFGNCHNFQSNSNKTSLFMDSPTGLQLSHNGLKSFLKSCSSSLTQLVFSRDFFFQFFTTVFFRNM